MVWEWLVTHHIVDRDASETDPDASETDPRAAKGRF